MAISTPTIFNAGLTGMMGGLQSQRSNTSTTGSDYAAQVTAALTFATALDTAVGVVTALTSAPGVTQVPGSAAQANASQSLPLLMQSVCQNYWQSRSISNVPATDNSASTYTAAVGAIKAEYNQTVLSLSTT